MVLRDTSHLTPSPFFPHALGELRPGRLAPSPTIPISDGLSPVLSTRLPAARNTPTDVSTGNNHIALPLWRFASGTSHYWRACAGKDGIHGQKKFRQAQAQRTAKRREGRQMEQIGGVNTNPAPPILRDAVQDVS